MDNPLNEHVERVYGPFLRELGAKHIQYYLDHGHEVDKYASAELGIGFSRDRGEEFITVCPIDRPDDVFDLPYLVEMLGCPTQDDMNLSSLHDLIRLKESVSSLFRSKYYRCFRAAYSLYENCRNLIGIKGAGWD